LIADDVLNGVVMQPIAARSVPSDAVSRVAGLAMASSNRFMNNPGEGLHYPSTRAAARRS
jgi:hypothetical protein